jgi:ABC-2 type transport system permease protein
MSAMLFELLKLLAIDLLFVAILLVIIAPLMQYKKAAWAVLKRNFVGYFANPTGYVFLCLFVFLTSVAAFWPHDFFIANLANLDQLNKYIAMILLVFVPAITMSIWAEERRQGTDELLLTLPAADFDIVIGKYLAAASIFTVSLLFSQFANYWILVSLASDAEQGIVDVDTGLFFTTYFGYWLMGMSMLAVGMVASFLTRNLTVSFILGMLFNAIPVVTYYADVLVPASATARQVSQWSFASQFDDFGRGVISLSASAFFVLIVVLGIYLSMVLIGKRHWLRHDATPASGAQQALSILAVCIAVPSLLALAASPILVGQASTICLTAGLLGAAAGLGLYWAAGSMARPPHSGSMAAHYTMRTLTLVVLLIGINSLLKHFDYRLLRYDATQGQVSSLSPDTKKLLREVATSQKRPIFVDAYVTAVVPEEYVKTRYNLISMLKELQRQSGGKVQVNLRENLELFSEEAAQAETRFGIAKQTIQSQARGAFKEQEFIMGVAFTSGLEKVVLPSFKLGMPVEYELVRSIATVAGEQRKKLGVVNTGAQLMGGFSMAGMQPRQIPKALILEELERQYKVEEVDPSNPIELSRYDVLLIVQPSSLQQPQLFNVVEAIKKGQPAAIFEDPFPMVMPQTVGTSMPNPPQGGMFGMGGQSPPKGDINALWKALEIQPTGFEHDAMPAPGQVVWQLYNPYPKFASRDLSPELVFIRDDMADNKEPFNREEPVVAHFEEVLFPYPTGIAQRIGAKLKFTELVSTADDKSGTIDVMELQGAPASDYEMDAKRGKASKSGYTLAAWIRGEPPAAGTASKAAEDEAEGEAVQEAPADSKSADAKSGDAKSKDAKAAEKKPDAPKGINVIYVGDIDVLSNEFVMMRNEPNRVAIPFRFDNVPFVCNIIDAVAGDSRFLEIRKRKPKHSTLRSLEKKTADASTAAASAREKKQAELEAEIKKRQADADGLSAKRKQLFEGLREKQQRGEDIDPAELIAAEQMFRRGEAHIQRELQVKVERLRRDANLELAKIDRVREQQVQQAQNHYKVLAVVPTFFPMLVGLIVWSYRRVREREGVSRSRMRS